MHWTSEWGEPRIKKVFSLFCEIASPVLSIGNILNAIKAPDLALRRYRGSVIGQQNEVALPGVDFRYTGSTRQTVGFHNKPQFSAYVYIWSLFQICIPILKDNHPAMQAN